MISAEVKATIRTETRSRLSAHIQVMRDALYSPQYDSADLVDNLGWFLSQKGLIPSDKAAATTRLSIAIYKSRDIDQYMLDATVGVLTEKPAIQPLLQKLAFASDSLTPEEFDTLMKAMLEDDRIVFGAIDKILHDPGIKAALNVPDSFDADSYIQGLKNNLRTSGSWEEFVLLNRQQGYLGPTVCTEVAVCVGLVAVLVAAVNCFAVASNYVSVYAVAYSVVVFTASGNLSEDVREQVSLQSGKLCSLVHNDTPRTIWVVIESPKYGYRRVPIPAGKTSKGIGLNKPVAVLIGGYRNSFDCYVDSVGQKHYSGALVLYQSDEISEIKVGGASYVPNDIQSRGESLKEAGYTDWNEIPLSICLPSMAMNTVGLATVEGFDLATSWLDQASVRHFEQTMRIKHMVDGLQGGLARD